MGMVDEVKAGKDLYAHFDTTEGKVVVKLFSKDAPKTVENFVGLATGEKEWTDPATRAKKTGTPLYDGTIFHRCIGDFMVQGGDPLGRGTGGPGYQFADEFQSGRKFDRPGLLAMANAGPNTNGSQFFIISGPQGVRLPPNYSLFGKAVSGLDVVAAIDSVGTQSGTPKEGVVIQSVTITEAD